MDADRLIDYCLAMPGTYLDYPFDDHTACVRLRPPSRPAGLILLMAFRLRGVPMASLRCHPDLGLMWRAMYPGVVVRGWHCPPVQQPYMDSFPLTGVVPDDDICEMADQAWDAVASRLPRRLRAELPDNLAMTSLIACPDRLRVK
ncbi:MAG: MmcQ/YjbR family DNA-binding protein [Propionibacteriaceae bacterium]|nr:MmcQ/YjbR family DNA-binding protein [Propionibacteriaceae bacterium]